MKNKKVFIVVGLGYGDEGKGTTVDYLTRKYNASTVVRFNGGSQAAHHVVDETYGLHCFSQFGSGMMRPDVKTYLSQFMLIDPLSMEAEKEVLEQKGVKNIFDRLFVNEDCLIITPFQRIAGQIKELSRGDEKDGSCGMGVGETVRDSELLQENCLRVRDLRDKDEMFRKLSFLRNYKVDIVEQCLSEHKGNEAVVSRLRKMKKTSILALVNYYSDFYKKNALHVVDKDYFRELLNESGAMIFEGAQGVLLDVDHGFYPHVTKTNTTFRNAEMILKDAGHKGKVIKVGVMRAYSTRHGAGPFVTEYKWLAGQIPDTHNAEGAWQGKFRVGWFDLVAARYALSVVGEVDYISLTNIDRLEEFNQVKVCTKYSCGEYGFVKSIECQIGMARGDRIELTKLLKLCSPVYQEVLKKDYISFLERGLDVKIAIQSFGPKAEDKRQIIPLD